MTAGLNLACYLFSIKSDRVVYIEKEAKLKQEITAADIWKSIKVK